VGDDETATVRYKVPHDRDLIVNFFFISSRRNALSINTYGKKGISISFRCFAIDVSTSNWWSKMSDVNYQMVSLSLNNNKQ